MPGQNTAGAQFLIVAVLALVAISAGELLSQFIDRTASLLLLALVVAFSAKLGGWRTGLFATLLCTFIAKYFFIYPLYSLRLHSLRQAAHLMLFLAISCCLTALVASFRTFRAAS